MGSDGFVSGRRFSNSYVKKKNGKKQGKVKQNKVDARKEEKIYKVRKEQGARRPSNVNEHEGQRAQGTESTYARKRELLQTKCNNGDVSWMNNAPVERSYHYRKDLYRLRNISCSSSCTGDDECLDDWETVADALSLTAENNQHMESHGLESEASRINYRAWSPDDVYRPRSLPLPGITRGPVFSWRCAVSLEPPTCPICCEDFDSTDSSFLPCPCGFRLCLFCHKTIMEVDGRCPGCRKHYDSVNVSAGYSDQGTHTRSKNSGF